MVEKNVALGWVHRIFDVGLKEHLTIRIKVMNCFIYKGIKRYDAYLYLEKEGDFSRVPAFLMKMMGGLEFVMRLELSPERKLVQADAVEVMAKLQQEGFYLQMPKKEQLVN